MSTDLLIVTLITAACLGAINLWLAFRIVRLRMTGNILIGDGENDVLAGKMRAHANLTEYAPFVLILMGLIELADGSQTVLAIVGALFVIARILHPIGMDRRQSNIPRASGALMTWLTLAFLSGWALIAAFGAL